MRSKTSCFNAAMYRKNLTRFAPVWLLYTLSLVLGVFLIYRNGGEGTAYWFAYNYSNDILDCMGIVTMGYALLAAQLLFGDLYNSRMCNALHAMPVRREGLFLANLLSGLTVSLVPTAIMTALALALVNGSVFTNAAQMVMMVFLAVNLEFICFFGMAVFCVMCTGNRFAMTAGYGLLNFGACIGYFLVDTLYTPMLYGIITPTSLMSSLTPLQQMWEYPYIKPVGRFRGVMDNTGKLIPGMTDSFLFDGNWWRLLVWAGVGIAFALAALMLYRKRNLECAGDAVAFKFLIPVFQIPCAIVVAAAVPFLMQNVLGVSGNNYLIIAFGLTVGWFVGKMLTARSTRVFQLKNWAQLGILAAVIAVTLFATKIDILGIETRQPKLENIEAIRFGTGYTADQEYTDPADMEAILTLQRLAVEDRLERSGTYIMENGQPVLLTSINRQNTYENAFYAADIHIVYCLKNGKTMERRYAIWSDQEEGDIARNLLSRWDRINSELVDIDGNKVNPLNLVLSTFQSINFDYADYTLMEQYQNAESAKSLIAAIQADCAAGTMAQDPFLHNGHFRYENAKYENGYYSRKDLNLYIDGEDWGWSVEFYPDSANTIRWFQERGQLNIDVLPENIAY